MSNLTVIDKIFVQGLGVAQGSMQEEIGYEKTRFQRVAK